MAVELPSNFLNHHHSDVNQGAESFFFRIGEVGREVIVHRQEVASRAVEGLDVVEVFLRHEPHERGRVFLNSLCGNKGQWLTERMIEFPSVHVVGQLDAHTTESGGAIARRQHDLLNAMNLASSHHDPEDAGLLTKERVFRHDRRADLVDATQAKDRFGTSVCLPHVRGDFFRAFGNTFLCCHDTPTFVRVLELAWRLHDTRPRIVDHFVCNCQGFLAPFYKNQHTDEEYLSDGNDEFYVKIARCIVWGPK